MTANAEVQIQRVEVISRQKGSFEINFIDDFLVDDRVFFIEAAFIFPHLELNDQFRDDIKRFSKSIAGCFDIPSSRFEFEIAGIEIRSGSVKIILTAVVIASFHLVVNYSELKKNIPIIVSDTVELVYAISNDQNKSEIPAKNKPPTKDVGKFLVDPKRKRTPPNPKL